MELHNRESARLTHGLDVPPKRKPRWRLLLSHLVKWIGEAARLRRDCRTLTMMSERELSDIGLTRVDVLAAYKYGRWPDRCKHRG